MATYAIEWVGSSVSFAAPGDQDCQNPELLLTCGCERILDEHMLRSDIDSRRDGYSSY